MASIPNAHIKSRALQKGFCPSDAKTQAYQIRIPTSGTHARNEEPECENGEPELEIRPDGADQKIPRKDGNQVSSDCRTCLY
jgi:hypothetical protein